MPLSAEDRDWLDKQKQKTQTPAAPPADKATEDEEPSRLGDLTRGIGRGLVDTGISAYHTAERIVDPTTSIRNLLGIPSLGELANRYIPQVGSATQAIRDAATLPPQASAFETGGKFIGEALPLFIPGIGAEAAGAKAASKAEELVPFFKKATDKAGEWMTGKSEYGPYTGAAPKSTFENIAAKKSMSAKEYQEMLRQDELAKAAGKRGPRTTGQKLGDIAAHEGPFMVAHHFGLPIWLAFTLARVASLAQHGNTEELLDMARRWMPASRVGAGTAIATPRPPEDKDAR